jgi:hypothetical protein
MSPVFRGLMNRTVAVRVPLDSQATSRNPNADNYREATWSPIPAAIQASSSASPEDGFFSRWPGATHSLWCARDCALIGGHMLSWDGTEAEVLGVEDEQGLHWRAALRRIPYGGYQGDHNR